MTFTITWGSLLWLIPAVLYAAVGICVVFVFYAMSEMHGGLANAFGYPSAGLRRWEAVGLFLLWPIFVLIAAAVLVFDLIRSNP